MTTPISTAATGLHPVLVITGMHRSGTSFVASLLQSSGLSIGCRMLGAYPSNPLGHFEDLDFVEYHQRLLRANACSDEGFVTKGVIHPAATYEDEARSLVSVRRAGGCAWGWKDPRSVLFLPFWQSLLPEAGFLLVFRPPWDVVDSLYRRGDLDFRTDPVLALDVWTHYNSLVRDFARLHPGRVVVCELSQAVDSPNGLIDRIRGQLGIPLAPAESTYRAPLLSAAEASHAAFLAEQAPHCAALLGELRELARSTPGSQSLPAHVGPHGLLAHGLTEWQRGRQQREALRRQEELLASARSELGILQQRVAEQTLEIARLRRCCQGEIDSRSS